VDQQRGLNQFHDSELGDVYDLYNACNGAMSGGLLDVSKLDELTAREREALDVVRLRKVWEHTATGCRTCAEIVRTLNIVRRAMQSHADGPPQSKSRPSPSDAPDHVEETALSQSQ
jgi:hypothetical protein